MDSFLNRRTFGAALAALLAACSSEVKPPAFPASISGGWSRASVTQSASPAPLLGSYTPEQTWEVMFSGPVPLNVTFHRMKSDTTAFELMQKWRPEAGATHFHHGSLFVVIKGAGLEPSRLNSIAKEVEDSLKR